MSILEALILSVVEGLTEFLPISSTAHLVLASRVLSIVQTDFVKSFEIAIQLGAILSVVVLYWKKFLVDVEVLKRVLVAFVPTAVVGVLMYRYIKTFLLGNLMVTVLALFVGGILIILFERVKDSGKGMGKIQELSYGQSVFIGIFQAISVIPGVSRAAATIFGGMIAGMDRSAAVEFSFLLAVPTMAGATGIDLLNSYQSFSDGRIWMMIAGFVGSFVVATAAIKFLLAYIKSNSFVMFGVYRILVSIAFWYFVLV